MKYDALRGLVWLERPYEHFASERAYNMWNSKFAHKLLKTAHKNYEGIKLVYNGCQYKLYHHRLIWALATGNWPINEIDHINGVRYDNRIENLREATHAQNHQNKQIPHITLDKRRNTWGAKIKVNGETTWLGSFKTQEAAYEAYLRAKAKLHTFQPVPRNGRRAIGE